MAAVDYFLKLDTIDGESQDSKHKNEIELKSFKWSGALAQSGGQSSGAGMGMGKVVPGPVECISNLEKSTPKLFSAMCGGTHLKTAVITARKSGAGQLDYCTLSLTEVTISKFDIVGGGPDGSLLVPIVNFSLHSSKMEWSYKLQKGDGTVAVGSTGGWDFSTNQKV